MRFRFSDSMLLKLALQKLKMSKVQFQKRMFIEHNLKDAKLLSEVKIDSDKTMPNTDVKLYSVDKIFVTKSHVVKTTKYHRIKDIELKKTPQANRPIIKIKKKLV